jgi:hypothetical protein
MSEEFNSLLNKIQSKEVEIKTNLVKKQSSLPKSSNNQVFMK